MRRFALLLFWLFLLGSARGQILNIEKFRLEGDSTGLIGNMGFGFAIVHQINDVVSLSSQANSAYLTEQHSYMLLSTLSFVKVNEEQGVVSQGYIHGRVNFHRKKTVSPEVFGQIQYDVGRGMDARRVLGGALRVIIIRADFLTIAGSSGLMFESEVWRDQDELEDGSDLVIKNNYLKSSWNLTARWQISPVAQFRFTGFYQARPEYFTEPRLSIDAQLLFKFSERFGFGNQFTGTFDSRPVIESGRSVYEFRSNFTWTFGK